MRRHAAARTVVCRWRGLCDRPRPARVRQRPPAPRSSDVLPLWPDHGRVGGSDHDDRPSHDHLLVAMCRRLSMSERRPPERLAGWWPMPMMIGGTFQRVYTCIFLVQAAVAVSRRLTPRAWVWRCGRGWRCGGPEARGVSRRVCGRQLEKRRGFPSAYASGLGVAVRPRVAVRRSGSPRREPKGVRAVTGQCPRRRRFVADES